MKRRDFLALLSSAGITVTLGGLSFDPDGELSSEGWGGRFDVSPRRQGVGHPVEVRLVLPGRASGGKPPELRALREGAPGWSERVDTAGAREASAAEGWRFEWVPPAVRPSSEETKTGLVRYRLVALDESGRAAGPVSEPIEVVCGMRGWGC